MYMDSLELLAFGSGGLLWGHSVASEFENRHGYSIVPYLPFMVCAAPMMASSTKWKYDPVVAVDITTVRKVRFDLLHTFTDLYIEHTLRPFRTYLNSVGIQLRAEISYGLPFELSRPGTEVDGIETESLEFGSQIDGYRLLAGVAHTFGKQFSSETGAVARNHINSHQFYDQIMATQFAAGISKTVLHGWASVAGAPGTEWPGHEGMWAIFGERFDARQPGSDFYSLWCQAMGRIQYLLRQGKPRIDVAILRTDHLVDNTCGIATKGDDGFVHVDEEVYENWWMRNRQNFWWQDLGMQDAGWSYEFLDGELLLRPEISFAEGLLQPGGPGYQAVIIYQDSLNPDVAKQLVRWARGGLRILLVDNVAELVLLRERRYHKNAAAASSTQGLDGRDEELAETIETLLSLPNARRITDPRDTMSTLVELGVRGRAEFVEPDINILTHLRDDGDVQHLYLYHFLYKNGSATDVTVSLDGAWEVQRVDHWSGRILDDVESNHADGRTTATLRMHPGQVTVLTTRRVAGTSVSSKNSANQRTMAVTGDWDLTVEDWDAGESEVITEDRGLGYVTKEERPVTKKTMIHVGETALLPWLQLEAVGPQVSGIGTYKTQIHLPSDFNTSKPSQLCLGSTCGGLGSVAINDTTAQGFDTSVPIIDTTDLFRPGANEVTVKVSTSLNNRLLSRGYYDSGHGPFLGGDFDPKYPAHAPRDYGLLGPVEVKYTT
ncbi:hypothetical protein HD553DRAFT_315119 [Filobasidium floriforme]|uniref:uncharacterized protein n=1 Tax=Filobasidium floriforme TaxID=5210 RepID=UPI001E8D22BE|nr:uncharacterized protein HD553DRAFT_315119 [Filobasidium floriforme]KAH8081881.1 hypothetical protein HD553DRAFT_315119 [Filobasidium floriforme]